MILLTSQEITPQTLTLPENISALALYGAPIRAYGLDAPNNQVATGAIASSKYSNYFKQTVDIRQALDFGIDRSGTVFVLLPERIAKFISGQEKEIKNPGINFSQGSKIKTYNTYLYVLNPKSETLYIFAKDGQLFSQLKSAELANAKDFAINEESKAGYILAADSILTIPLP